MERKKTGADIRPSFNLYKFFGFFVSLRFYRANVGFTVSRTGIRVGRACGRIFSVPSRAGRG